MHDLLEESLEAELRRSAELASLSGDPLRVWVPRCGTGARAYAVAIVLIETLGRRWREVPVRVLATDPDPSAIARAKAGLFRPEELGALPHSRRARFFRAEAAGLRAHPLLRQVCLFTTEGAASAPPRSRPDIVVGGESETQAFVGDVVHELRAPVAVIQGFAETLRLGVRDPKDRVHFLRAIENHSGRVARLVDRLLDLSAAQRNGRRARPSPLPAARAVRDVVCAFSPLARRRGVKLRVDVDARLAVLADASDLPHILGNLLDNAIKFSPRGAAVAVRGRAQAGQALLSVEDAGPGVPAEDLERVFERFYRGQRTRAVKGTGLGLAIARAMAKANGGRVWAENRRSGGAAFYVALPLAPVLESSR